MNQTKQITIYLTFIILTSLVIWVGIYFSQYSDILLMLVLVLYFLYFCINIIIGRKMNEFAVSVSSEYKQNSGQSYEEYVDERIRIEKKMRYGFLSRFF